MKKIVLIVLITTFSSYSYAQEKTNFFVINNEKIQISVSHEKHDDDHDEIIYTYYHSKDQELLYVGTKLHTVNGTPYTVRWSNNEPYSSNFDDSTMVAVLPKCMYLQYVITNIVNK